MDSTQRVALVTGSSTGLGRFVAERMLDQGYQVFGCSRGDISWHRAGYTHLQADISEADHVAKLFDQVRRDAGRLDALINNAGIASMNHSLLMPSETVKRIMDVNFCGAFYSAREAAKLMRRDGHGRIVNLTSIAVPLRLEGEGVYAASKSALETLTRIMARELAAFGITVNAVGPSLVDTRLTHGLETSKREKLLERLALKQVGSAEDVMNVVDFLLREKSASVTGQVIYLGGAG